MLPIIKQIEEKNLPYVIDHMIWNDRMDLVAYSTTKGEVALHRLSWARAWVLSPPGKNIKVKCITFRPDGKVIAVGYSNGEVWIVSIENKAVCTCLISKRPISCMSWVQEKTKLKSDTFKISTSNEDQHQNYTEYIDLSASFLAEPPLLYAEDNICSPKKRQRPSLLHEQHDLNILAVGSEDGFINLYIYGEHPFVEYNLKDHIENDCIVKNILFKEDLSKISATVKFLNNDMKIVIIDSSIITSRTKEIFAFSNRCIQLTYLTEVIYGSIRSMKESWESILIEMDNKLSKYANKCPKEGFAAEFLDLLMFGKYTDNMQEFLLHDLTKKGLEKLGEAIDVSYSNMQELLSKYITKYGQSITYHLAELRGMVRMKHEYYFVDANEDDITEAIRSAGAFLIKAEEMHQTINNSIVNYKCFFKWLYRVMIILQEDVEPPEIHNMTQQELLHISELFENFDNTEGNVKGFMMEKLGQYLSNNHLTMPPKMEENEWSTFLSENGCLQNDPIILNHDESFSLVQQFDKLRTSISSVSSTSKHMHEHFKMTNILNCLNSPVDFTAASINREESMIYFIPKSKLEITLLQIDLNNNQCCTRSCDFNFIDQSDKKIDYEISDMKIYTSSTLSLLLTDAPNRTSVLYQFPIEAALSFAREINIKSKNLCDNPNLLLMNGTYLNPKIYKDIQMIGSQLAVSGSRRVGIVLSANKHKVKLFEMECEEDDDDEEEDADMSM